MEINKSIKILIVEDDVNYRYMLSKMMPWSENGCLVVGEMVNGRQALEYLKDHPVDIVLTDVSMPLKNGIELVKEIRSKDTATGIIMLSAYDDFDFVKEALLYGADDYLLKQDITEAELFQIVSKVINKKREQFIKQESQKNWLCKSILSYLNDMEILNDEIKALLQIRFDKHDVMILSVKGTEISKELEQFLEIQGGRIWPLGHDEQKGWIILCFEEEENRISGTLDKINQLCKEIRNLSSENAMVFCSDVVKNIEEMKSAYDCFRYINDFVFYHQKGGIYMGSNLEYFERKRNRQYIFLFDKNEKKESEQELEQLLDEMISEIEKKMPEENIVNENFCNYYHVLEQKFSYIKSDRLLFDYMERIKSSRSLTQKKKVTLQELKQCYKYRLPEKIEYSPEIKKALDYIWNNYQKEIGLRELADYTGLSENYFSNRFKYVMGENVTAYINRVRIEKAKNLLENTNMKVYEISQAVGYNNSTYFSTMFKKIEKRSISEFRQNTVNS